MLPLTFFSFFTLHNLALHIAILRVFAMSLVLSPLKVNGLSHLWVIVCFSVLSLYLYMSDKFTFLDPYIGLFPQRLDTSLCKFLSSVPFHTLSCMWMLCAFIHMSHTICLIPYLNHICVHDFHGHNI